MPQKLPLRRAHLISPLGVGSIIEFPRDESLMTAGLDTWPLARESCPPEWKIVEERLQARLNVSHFRLPPDYREPMFGVRHALQKIPCVRFPRWHYCPRCGYMEKTPTLFRASPLSRPVVFQREQLRQRPLEKVFSAITLCLCV